MKTEITTDLPEGTLLDFIKRDDGLWVLVHPNHKDLLEPDKLQLALQNYKRYVGECND